MQLIAWTRASICIKFFGVLLGFCGGRVQAMAWGRLIQLARTTAGPQECWIRAAATQSTTQWWRSMSSSISAMETCRTSQSSFKQEIGVANAAGSSGDDGVDAILCGRGDKKTKRGKRFKHSFGNPRESRGTTTRRLRKKWELSYDPLVPIHSQPFPPLLS
jgi:ribosomal small subunit protein bTHX